MSSSHLNSRPILNCQICASPQMRPLLFLGYVPPVNTMPAVGERADVAAVTQSQVAATLAALLGEDYPAAVPKAAKPIVEVLGKR